MNLRRFFLVASLVASPLALPACVADADVEDAESAEEAMTAGPPTALVDATGGATTRVRAGGITVWVENVAKPRYVGNELWVTARLRTSRSLASAMSWVPDDGFGDARVVSPRVVEIDLRGGHEINSILSGLPLFVHLTTRSGAVRDYDVRLDLAPRFARFEGSSQVFVHEAIKPIWVRRGGDALLYRGKVERTGATEMNVFTDDDADPDVKSIGPGAFQFDWDYDRLELSFDYPSDPVHFSAQVGGQFESKRAGIDLAVARVGLTREGADKAWPRAACQADVRQCIEAAGGPATADLGACGLYREVSRCLDALTCEPGLFDRPQGNLGAARSAYNAACPNGGTWCSVTELRAHDVGGCEDAPSLDAVAKAVAGDERDPYGFGEGTTLTRAELAQRSTFARHGGPQLLAAIDAYVGTTNLIAKEYVSEVPCHNCTEHAVRYVLFYTDTQVVVVVDGKRGYDS